VHAYLKNLENYGAHGRVRVLTRRGRRTGPVTMKTKKGWKKRNEKSLGGTRLGKTKVSKSNRETKREYGLQESVWVGK